MTRPRTALLRRALLAAAILFVLVPSAAHAQATRTWVSGEGNDANPCSRTAACQTLAGAISKTAVGGEINALDPAGFGVVTITKAITIDLSTTGRASVLNTATTGIIINAPADADVVLRALSVNGAQSASPPTCEYSGVAGIRFLAGGSLLVDDSSIERQATGISFAPNASAVKAMIANTTFSNVCGRAIDVSPQNGGSAAVTVDDVRVFNAGTGIFAGTGASVWLGGTTISGTGTGLQSEGGTITATAPNTIFGNAADGAPTASVGTAAAPRTGPAGPAGAPGPAGPAGAPGPAGTPARRLLLAVPTAKLSARAGRRVALTYASTLAGSSTLEVRKGSKLLAREAGRVKAGRNTTTFSGKVKRKALAPGTYVLRLIVRSADGQTDAESATLRVRR